MILRRLFTLTALTVAALLSHSGRASAGYDVSTSVDTTSLLFNGVSQALSPIGAGSTINIAGTGAGTQNVTFTYGGASYSDGNVTVYFFNNVSPVVAPGFGTGANEQIFVGANSGVSATDTFSFKVNVAIDPNVVSTYTQAFVLAQPSYTILTTAGTFNPAGPPTIMGQSSVNIGGLSFSITAPITASGGTVNSGGSNANINAQISSVPEPASVVMLGAGLVGVVGLSLRRRKGQV